MCGIAGFSARTNTRGQRQLIDPTKMRWLIYENESRGTQSAGIFSVNANGKEHYIKKAISATDFVKRDDVSLAIANSDSIIAHTRAATSGSVTDENAHPFLYGDDSKNHPRVVGVHNGFVIDELSPRWIGEGKLFPKPFNVDSELIFALLAEKNGDFKILPEIEGAIATAFMMPTRYPGFIFLYKRQARDLHIGHSVEGIYFSSEAEPLELIECSQITSAPDDKLVLLKDGLIYDTLKLKQPKLKSIKNGAFKTNWEYALTDDELDQYPGLKEKKRPKYSRPAEDWEDKNYYACSNHRHGGGTGSSSWKKPSEVLDEADNRSNEILATVVKDIEELTSKLAPQILKAKKIKTPRWEDCDFSSCILALKLVNDVDGEPLQGWLVYDKQNKALATATMPNGVTGLKYGSSYCDTERELIICDPIDGASIYSFSFKPEQSRVMEVTLSVPFRKEGSGVKSRILSPSDKKLRTMFNEAGRTSSAILPSRLGVFGPSGKGGEQSHLPLLLEQKNDVHREYAKRKDDGDEEQEGDRGPTLQVLGDVNAAANRNREPLPRLIPAELKTILEKEDRLFIYKGQAKSMIYGKEATALSHVLRPCFSAYINIQRVLSDAAVVKLHRKEKGEPDLSLSYYGINLLYHFTTRYKIHESALTERRMRNLKLFYDNFLIGKMTMCDIVDAPEKSPLEVWDSVGKTLKEEADGLNQKHLIL